MASRNPNRTSKTAPASGRRQPDRYPPRPAAEAREGVDPKWLLKALGATIAAAIVLGYLSICLLVYQGGWQLILHPATKMDAKPAVPFDLIHFDAAETGAPRLTAWWLPAESPTTLTILYLHGGDGSLSNSASKLDLLHQVGANVFAIDYRGYGLSSGPHPTESRMFEDAAAALDDLTATRHIPAASIVPYGEGLGAVLAARLAHEHPELLAYIVDTPDPDAFSRATRSPQSRLLPMRLLVQEHFDIAAALDSSKTPKLLLADGFDHADPQRTHENQALFHVAPTPKMTVTFEAPSAPTPYLESIHRFLDEYVPHI